MRRQAAVSGTCRTASRRRSHRATRETRGKSRNTLSADKPDIDLGYRPHGDAHRQLVRGGDPLRRRELGVRIDLISPCCLLISFKAPHPISMPSRHAVQKVMSGLRNLPRSSACTLSGGDHWCMFCKCSSRSAMTSDPVRSSRRICMMLWRVVDVGARDPGALARLRSGCHETKNGALGPVHNRFKWRREWDSNPRTPCDVT